MSSDPPPPEPPSAQPPPPPAAEAAATWAAATDTAAPASAQPPPPPPPPAAPSFDAAGQARALFSRLDPTGIRPTLTVAGILLAMFFGAQLVNAIIPQPGVGPGVPGPGGPGPVGPGPIPTTPTGQPTPGPGGPVTTPLPPASTLTLGPLRIPLEGGWTPQEVPDSNIIVRLVKGNVGIDVFSATIQGQADAAAVYNFYLQDLQSNASGFSAAQPNLIQIGNGIPAARGNYTGVFGQSQIEGQVTTIVVGASGFIFDVWGNGGTLSTLLPEAQRMIDNIQVQ